MTTHSERSEPTERSNRPATTTNVTPTAIIPATAFCRKTCVIFSTLINSGSRIDRSSTTAKNPISTTLRFASAQNVTIRSFPSLSKNWRSPVLRCRRSGKERGRALFSCLLLVRVLQAAQTPCSGVAGIWSRPPDTAPVSSANIHRRRDLEARARGYDAPEGVS